MTYYANKKLNIVTKTGIRRGFSLLEIITVMLISSMVMISTLAIFNQVRKATASINAKLDKEDITDEILHRIAVDLDRLAAPGFDTKVTIQNKMVGGHIKSRMTIENKFYDKNSKPQTFEKVVWHSEYDVMEKRLILYRHHSGLSLEDKILDGDLEEKQSDGTERYIPISDELTVFQIVVPVKDADPLTKWDNAKLPASVGIKISNVEPVENLDGILEVYEEDIIFRTIAVDRTRKLRFIFKKKDFTRPEEDEDPNDVDSETSEETDLNNKKDDKKTDDAILKEKTVGTTSTTKPR